MEEITLSDNVRTDGTKLPEVEKRILQKFQLAIEKVGANQKDAEKYPLAPEQNSFEQIINRYLQSLPIDKRFKAINHISEWIDGANDTRKLRYGNLVKIDLTRPVSIEAQAKTLPVPNALKTNIEYLKSLNMLLPPILTTSGGLSRSRNSVVQPLTGKLDILITEVRCVDRKKDTVPGEKTNEIYLGGLSVSSDGSTKSVVNFFVQDFSNEARQRIYCPARQFAWFSLTGNHGSQVRPATFFATFVLVEQDWGNVSTCINDLHHAVRDEVVATLKGVITPFIFPVISRVIVSALSGAIKLLVKATNNKVYSPKTVSCTINALNGTWKGSTESPVQVAVFDEFDSKYELEYRWRKFK